MHGIPEYLSLARPSAPESLAVLRSQMNPHCPSLEFATLTLKPGQRIQSESGMLFAWPTSHRLNVKLEGDWQRSDGGEASDTAQLAAGDALRIGPGAAAVAENAGDLWCIGSFEGRQPGGRLVRLADLPDTAGGCNPGENAFRRLQLIWDDQHATPERPDGDNVLGCHVVWIAEATSRAHYHPVPPVPGGAAQHEMYLVLDPKEFGLTPSADRAGVWTWPGPDRLDEPRFTPLSPGDVVFIPAPVVHRAVDVLACVIGIPGFKSRNELYVDPPTPQD